MPPIHRTPLRGRGGELARAATLLELARDVGQAGAVVVRGPAGSGKSRLLHAVADDAAARGFRLLEGSGDADATAMPLAPLMQAVLGGTPALMDRRVVLEALRIDDARYVVVEEMIEALEHAARTQPLMVMIDDLQFSDSTTLFALRVMAERLAAEPVVWLVAAREPVHEDAVARTIDRLETLNAETLSVSTTTTTAATEIAQDLVGGVLDENLARIVERAEGQVLDLVETLRGMVDENRIVVLDGCAHLADSSMPTRLRDSIGRRLARLDPGAVEVIATGAVVGRQISVPVVAVLVAQSTDQVSAALRAGERAQLVVNINGQWRFRHDLIRDAIELTLPPERRRELRRAAVDIQLAAGTPVIEVATALAATARTGDGHAADLLEQAARDVAAMDPSGAADLVGRAAAISVGDSAARARLLAQQVMLLWQAGRAPDAQRIGEEALIAGLAPLQEAEVRLGLARVTSEHSYLDAGRQAAAGLELPGLPDDMRVKLLATQCVTKIMTNDFDGLEGELATALQLAQASADRASEASLLATRSTLSLQQMDWAAAFDEAERGMRVAEHMIGETSMWAPKALWQAILLSTAGSCDTALAITDRGIAEAAAARHGSALSLWMMIRCRVLLEAGRLHDAQVEAESVLTMTDWRERSTMADYTVHFVLRRVAQYTGDPAALNRTQSGAGAMARDGVSSVRRQGKWLAAIDADTDGRPDVAIELTAEGVAAYGGLGNAFSLDPADEPLFARIAGRARRPDLADRAARFTELRAQRNPQVPFLAAIARHTRGLVDDDADALGEAVQLFAGTRRPLPRAAALEDAGRVSPHVDIAIPLLDQAHDLYADAGALRDAARVRQRLRSLGQRRRQPRHAEASVDQLAGLTQSELAVVELVARGATNREVAAQLFLSPHTVSTHLRHAFTKVGVRSRTELARITTLTEKAT